MENIKSNSKSEDEENIMKLTYDNPDIDKIIPSCRENSSVQRDKIIGEYLTKYGKKFPILAPFYGKITKINLEEKYFIIERCKHEAFYINFCVECNYDRRTSPEGNRPCKYSSLHPVLMFNEEVTSHKIIMLINFFKYLI
jgi:hypothetical protein